MALSLGRKGDTHMSKCMWIHPSLSSIPCSSQECVFHDVATFLSKPSPSKDVKEPKDDKSLLMINFAFSKVTPTSSLMASKPIPHFPIDLRGKRPNHMLMIRRDYLPNQDQYSPPWRSYKKWPLMPVFLKNYALPSRSTLRELTRSLNQPVEWVNGLTVQIIWARVGLINPVCCWTGFNLHDLVT